jgi:hypothetical protein
MFNFPSQTVVNKEFKVIDILKQIKADSDLRLDASKIDSLLLANVINKVSISCEPNNVFKEIYIFEIKLNKREVPMKFIAALDKSIKFHTYFICRFGEEIFSTLAFKNVDTKVEVGRYHFHSFQKFKMIELPSINDVKDFYTTLYSYEVGIKKRNQEFPEDYFKRTNLIHRLEFQISKTEAGIKYELQPRKKYEYHERLLKYRKELQRLVKENV